jgi:hypothetical protein
MTPQELRNNPAVIDLIELQKSTGKTDADFTRSMGFRFSPSTWNKVKNMTYFNDLTRIHKECESALSRARSGAHEMVVTLGNIVVLKHVKQVLDAVDIAKARTDEHGLVIVVGKQGAGKSAIERAVHAKHPGHYMHARPSWGGGYLMFLKMFAAGIGIQSNFKSAGEGETAIINAAHADPNQVIIIGEFNHCSANSINFLKSILNETSWKLLLGTIPSHLARMASDATLAEESRQLLRRAVAIVHIPDVFSSDVEAVCQAFYPHVNLSSGLGQLVAAANRLNRMDTVCEVLTEIDPEDPTDGIPQALERHEALLKAVRRPKSD